MFYCPFRAQRTAHAPLVVPRLRPLPAVHAMLFGDRDIAVGPVEGRLAVPESPSAICGGHASSHPRTEGRPAIHRLEVILDGAETGGRTVNREADCGGTRGRGGGRREEEESALVDSSQLRSYGIRCLPIPAFRNTQYCEDSDTGGCELLRRGRRSWPRNEPSCCSLSGGSCDAYPHGLYLATLWA